MDEFYIHLYSDFNVAEYPQNRHNSFTNIIKPEITLDGDFEVGISNIIFQPNLYTIKKGDKAFGMWINVQFGTRELMGLHGFTVKYVPTTDLSADNIHTLLKEIDKDLVSFLHRQSVIEKYQTSIIKYRRSLKFPTFEPLNLINLTNYKYSNVQWNLSYEIADLLGVADPVFNNQPEFYSTPKFPSRSDFLNVYCDIVQPSYVGQQLVNILDVIPMSHMYSKTVMMNLYKRVSQTRIQDISIKISDESGRDAFFSDTVKMYIILHFKRII